MYRSRFISLAVALLVIFFPSLGWSVQLKTCKRLIPVIAREVGVPTSLLMAIAFVESHYQPYALNHGGQALSFETPGEAAAYLEGEIVKGETNIDIGCMQVNWHSHQKNIGDPKALLIPTYNIRYAAKFLKSLYEELGSWAKAVAAYHSKTSTKGQSYLVRISTYLMNERHHHDQRNAEALPYSLFPLYRPPSSLVWGTFQSVALSSVLYTQRVSAPYGCPISRYRASSSLCPRL